MTYLRSKAQAGRGSIFAIGPVSGSVAPTSLTGGTTSASAVVTMASTAGVAVGMGVAGTGIAPGATVLSIIANTSITLSAPSTATGSAIALTFSIVYILVGEIKNTDPGKGQFDKEDVSNFESDLDKEYLKLMRDNGAPKISGNRVSGDAGQLAVVAAYNDGDNPYMIQITLPINKKIGQTTTGDVYTYDALVMGQSFGPVEVNKAIPFECELQITGPVTFTAGS